MITAWFLIGWFVSTIVFLIFASVTKEGGEFGLVISLLITVIIGFATWFVLSLF